MRETASIQVEDADHKVLFEWLDFDGDDCFRDFHIVIENETGTERFDFGDCAIWGLRKCVRFFRGRLDKAEGGFRFPDIRTYDLARTEDGFSLQIGMEGTNRSEQFQVRKPALTFDDQFLEEYDTEES